MQRWIWGLIAASIGLGVSARISDGLFSGQLRPRIQAPISYQTVIKKNGAQPFCFSKHAEVLLSAGVDGLPGQAGEDDNQDGLVDNSLEIGAVPSDDRCLAPSDVGYQSIQSGTNSIVISRGAYVPCPPGQAPERILSVDGWWIK